MTTPKSIELNQDKLRKRACRLVNLTQIHSSDIVMKTEASLILRQLCGGATKAIIWIAREKLTNCIGWSVFMLHSCLCKLGYHKNYFAGCVCSLKSTEDKTEYTTDNDSDSC